MTCVDKVPARGWLSTLTVPSRPIVISKSLSAATRHMYRCPLLKSMQLHCLPCWSSARVSTPGLALCAGLSDLAQALPHATCLTYLHLSSCGIGDSGASDLADAIADPFFSIADKAALTEEFHGHAPTSAAVRVLKLRDNHITRSGVQELGEAMQQSTALQDLDLAGNEVRQHCTCLNNACCCWKLCTQLPREFSW